MDVPLNEIIVGDCLEVMKDWPDRCVDLVVTDPPFYLPARIATSRRKWPRTLADLGIMNSYFSEIFSQCAHLLKQEGAFYTFSDSTSYAVFLAICYPLFDRTQCIVWDKINGGLGNGWRHANELILHGAFADTGYTSGFRCDVLKQAVVPSIERQHASEKPLVLLAQLIEAHPAAVILDPFCGSGTTCVAAKMLGRNYIGIDISEEYCERARERLKAVETGVPPAEARAGQMSLWSK
jgi:DNA modification methylase